MIKTLLPREGQSLAGNLLATLSQCQWATKYSSAMSSYVSFYMKKKLKVSHHQTTRKAVFLQLDALHRFTCFLIFWHHYVSSEQQTSKWQISYRTVNFNQLKAIDVSTLEGTKNEKDDLCNNKSIFQKLGF